MFYIVSLFKVERYGDWIRGWAFQRSAPSANQEPADDPATVVENDRPTDDDVGFSTCSTYESCPDSPSSDRYIPMLLIVVCTCIQRGNQSFNTAGYRFEGIASPSI